MKLSHIKWTSIERFHNVYSGIKTYSKINKNFVPPKIVYNAKVKLDGTNAGIQVLVDGTIKTQSRTRMVTSQRDNKGFANWVENNKQLFSDCAKDVNFVIFGEWCGEGIQKAVAISKIQKKIFVVYAVLLLTEKEENFLIVEPELIRQWIPQHEDMFVLPWYYKQENEIVIDFSKEFSAKNAVDLINTEIEKVENLDPWVFDNFGVEGIGEGLVYYPVVFNDVSTTTLATSEEIFSRYLFKAKGEKHKIVKQSKAAQVDPEILNSVNEFVDMFLTDPRLEQGVQEACNELYELKYVGDFVQWIAADVKKESETELEASGLDWKQQIYKTLASKASVWYRARI